MQDLLLLQKVLQNLLSVWLHPYIVDFKLINIKRKKAISTSKNIILYSQYLSYIAIRQEYSEYDSF